MWPEDTGCPIYVTWGHWLDLYYIVIRYIAWCGTILFELCNCFYYSCYIPLMLGGRSIYAISVVTCIAPIETGCILFYFCHVLVLFLFGFYTGADCTNTRASEAWCYQFEPWCVPPSWPKPLRRQLYNPGAAGSNPSAVSVFKHKCECLHPVIWWQSG